MRDRENKTVEKNQWKIISVRKMEITTRVAKYLEKCFYVKLYISTYGYSNSFLEEISVLICFDVKDKIKFD